MKQWIRIALVSSLSQLSYAAVCYAAPPSSDRNAAATAASSPSELSPTTLLQRAMDLYLEGQYQEAAEQLRPLVETRQLRDQADRKEALRAYGISLYLSGGASGAERAFRDLLRLDPAARLDPAFVRPDVIQFFERVRQKGRAELKEIVRQHGPQGSAAVNLLPPWGQFNNGHRTKGYTVLGGELLFSALSITTAALLFTWQGDTMEFKGRESEYSTLKTINTISFAALATVLVYGVVFPTIIKLQDPSRRQRQKWG